MNGYRHKCHCVHRLTYHMVFVTKWRKPVITDRMGDYMIARARELFRLCGGDLVSGETDRDHIHLLAELPPNCNVSAIVRMVKTQLSKGVHQFYRDEVQKYLHGDAPFWSPSYFIETTGSVSLDTVKQYIESQRTEDNQSKAGRKKKGTV